MVLGLEPKFEKIIRNQVTYKSANLGCNLLISRMQKNYAANQTQDVLSSCVKEMKVFFEKYNAVMKNDIEALSQL
jgi:hypothetical protein